MKQKRKVFWFDGKCYDSDKPINPNTHWNFKVASVTKPDGTGRATFNPIALDDDKLAKYLNEIMKPYLPSLANKRKRRNKIRRLQKKKA